MFSKFISRQIMFRLYGDGKIDIYFLTGSENCKLLLGDASFSVFLFFVGWGGAGEAGDRPAKFGKPEALSSLFVFWCYCTLWRYVTHTLWRTPVSLDSVYLCFTLKYNKKLCCEKKKWIWVFITTQSYSVCCDKSFVLQVGW